MSRRVFDIRRRHYAAERMSILKKHGQERLTAGYSCVLAATIDIIGGKWKCLILFHLLEATRRFGELQRLLPGITQHMLTLQLRELEEDGVVFRNVYREVPPKVEYSLTDFGKTLRPILLQMCDWGQEYMQTLVERKQDILQEKY